LTVGTGSSSVTKRNVALTAPSLVLATLQWLVSWQSASGALGAGLCWVVTTRPVPVPPGAGKCRAVPEHPGKQRANTATDDLGEAQMPRRFQPPLSGTRQSRPADRGRSGRRSSRPRAASPVEGTPSDVRQAGSHSRCGPPDPKPWQPAPGRREHPEGLDVACRLGNANG
jgi:hypothetical protein